MINVFKVEQHRLRRVCYLLKSRVIISVWASSVLLHFAEKETLTTRRPIKVQFFIHFSNKIQTDQKMALVYIFQFILSFNE